MSIIFFFGERKWSMRFDFPDWGSKCQNREKVKLDWAVLDLMFRIMSNLTIRFLLISWYFLHSGSVVKSAILSHFLNSMNFKKFQSQRLENFAINPQI